MRRLRNIVSYANVTATVTVFLAMSGAAVAVTTAPKNSVVSGSIKDGEVRTADLHGAAVTAAKLGANSVGSGKVVDGSLNGADVKDDSLRARDLGADSVGASELAGDSVSSAEIADGGVGAADLGEATVSTPKVADQAITSGKLADGAVGSREIANRSITGEDIATTAIVHAYAQTVTVPATSSRKTLVTCPFAGEVPVSGGGYWEGSNDSFVNLWMMESHPNLTANGWYTRVSNPGQTSRNWNAIVVCLG